MTNPNPPPSSVPFFPFPLLCHSPKAITKPNSNHNQPEQPPTTDTFAVMMDTPAMLDWSSKQGRILTSENEALAFYSAKQGYPFQEDELPHYCKVNSTTHSTFSGWRDGDQKSSALVGAWSRPLFASHFGHSSSETETCYNLQSPTLFIDLRLPTGRRRHFNAVRPASFSAMSEQDLRVFARVHVFAGYTKPNHPAVTPATKANSLDLLTRHHCIDWNYIGLMRPRPNKWYGQFKPGNDDVWRESSYAKDPNGESYYFERWERIEGDGEGKGRVVAMRVKEGKGRDGIIIVVGNHFNYIVDRSLVTSPDFLSASKNLGVSSLPDLVDKCLEEKRRDIAEWYLSIDGGHGVVEGTKSNKQKFKVTDGTRPWNEGKSLAKILSEEYGTHTPYARARVYEEEGKVHVDFAGVKFEVFESNCGVGELKALFSDAHLEGFASKL